MAQADDARSDSEKAQSDSKKTLLVVITAAVIALILLLVWYWQSTQEPQPFEPIPVSEPVAVIPPAVVQEPAPQVVYEAPEPVVTTVPLPALNESDTNVLSAIQGLSQQALKYAVPDEVVRKFVRAINALEEGKVVHEYRPIVSPSAGFIAEELPGVDGEPKQYRLSPKNYQRYDPYVTLLANLDTDQVMALYKRFYPLLEEAYAEMGLRKGNFHSVFIAGIDNILAATVIEDEVLLVRPKVFYEYADPALEKSSEAQRLLLRMGPENSHNLQESLRKLRAALME
jgi:hypothetical protein